MSNCQVVSVLVQQGAKVDILNSSKHSPLYFAALGSYLSSVDRTAVKALIAAGANPHLGNDLPLNSKDVSPEMKNLIRENLLL